LREHMEELVVEITVTVDEINYFDHPSSDLVLVVLEF